MSMWNRLSTFTSSTSKMLESTRTSLSQLTTSVLAEIGPDEPAASTGDGTGAGADGATPTIDEHSTPANGAAVADGKSGAATAAVKPPLAHTTAPIDANGFGSIDLTHAPAATAGDAEHPHAQPHAAATAAAAAAAATAGGGGTATAAEWRDAFEKQQVQMAAYKSELLRLRDQLTHAEGASQEQTNQFRRIAGEKEEEIKQLRLAAAATQSSSAESAAGSVRALTDELNSERTARQRTGDELNHLRSQLSALQSQFAAEQKQSSTLKSNLESSVAAAAASAKQQQTAHDAALTAQRAELEHAHAQQTQSLESQWRSHAATVESQYRKQMEEAMNAAREQLTAQFQAHQTQQMEAINAHHQNAIAAFEAANKSTEQRAADAESALAAAQQLVAQAQQQAADANATATSAAAAATAAKAAAAAAEAELKAKSSAGQSATDDSEAAAAAAASAAAATASAVAEANAEWNRRWSAQLSAHQTELDTARRELNSVQQKLAAAISESNQRTEAANAANTAHAAAMAAATAAAASANEQLRAATDANRQHSAQTAQLTEQLAAAQSAIQALKSEHRTAIDSLTAAHSEQLESARRQAQKAGEELQSLTSQYEQSSKDGQQLTAQRIKMLEDSLRAASDQLSALQTNESNLTRQCQQLTAQLAAASGNDASVRDALAAALRLTKTDGESVSSLVGKLAAAYNKFGSELEQSNAANKKLRDTMAATAASAKGDSAAAQQQAAFLAATTQRYESLQSAYSKLQAELREASRLSEEHAKEKNGWSEQMNRLLGENRELRTKVDHERSTLGSAANQSAVAVQELRAQITSYETIIKNLQTESEERVKEKVKTEHAHEQEINKVLLRVKDAEHESERLRNHLKETAGFTKHQNEERSREVDALQKRVAQYQADAAVMESLAGDFQSLKHEFALKSEECERHHTAWTNLQSVLEQFQSDAATRAAAVERQLADAHAQAGIAKKAMADAREIDAKYQTAMSQARTVRDQLTGAQKYVLKLEHENTTLRKGFEQTMHRLKNFSSDDNNLVDRRVVVKMWLTYFERRDKDEVLELMSRILQFTDAEKKKLLASRRAEGVTGAISKFSAYLPTFGFGGGAKSAASTAASGDPLVLKGDQSLADLWVDFLLKETQQPDASGGAGGAAGSPQPTASATGAGSPLPPATALDTTASAAWRQPPPPLTPTAAVAPTAFAPPPHVASAAATSVSAFAQPAPLPTPQPQATPAAVATVSPPPHPSATAVPVVPAFTQALYSGPAFNPAVFQSATSPLVQQQTAQRATASPPVGVGATPHK